MLRASFLSIDTF